jgi:ATP-binding cassette, subfamily B, bacterial MsbA
MCLVKEFRKVSTGCQECIADLNSFLHETFSGNKIVKAFGMENYEKKRFYEKTKSLFKIEMSQVVAKSLSSPVMEVLGGLGIGFIIWYGGYRVMSGTSTAGTFFSFMAGVLMLYEPVKKLAKLNNNIQEGMAAADRIFDIIEYESDIKEEKNPVHIVRRPHSVRFENVYFRYEDDWVLKDINLKVDSGEIIALVGMSGGGKTSLVNLIPRFYDVTEGTISIDDIDIRKLSIPRCEIRSPLLPRSRSCLTIPSAITLLMETGMLPKKIFFRRQRRHTLMILLWAFQKVSIPPLGNWEAAFPEVKSSVSVSLAHCSRTLLF